jgi:hypothetical protein
MDVEHASLCVVDPDDDVGRQVMVLHWLSARPSGRL